MHDSARSASYLQIPVVRHEQMHVPPPEHPSQRSGQDTWPATESECQKAEHIDKMNEENRRICL